MRGGVIVLAIVIAAFTVIKYCGNTQYNEVTGEKQHISMTVDQEIALGLHSAPQMTQQYGGLHPSSEGQQLVDNIGQNLVAHSDALSTEYKFDFHLLADDQTINAFALPGGQIFITAGLMNKLENQAQLAGVLAHEIAHVTGRHSAQQIAKQELTQGLTGAAVMASGDYSTQAAAQMISNVINMNYSREDELESDEFGVKFMIQAGYDPTQMIRVQEILAESSSSNRPPEIFSTHPSSENRIRKIEEDISKYKKLLN